MADRDELKIPLTENELERIRKAADERGLDMEVWAREELLRILRERSHGS